VNQIFFLSLINIDYASDELNELFLDGEHLGQSQRMRVLSPARSEFAVEEMISITRTCRSLDVGRGIFFPDLL
jgi:hypothetical protein